MPRAPSEEAHSADAVPERGSPAATRPPSPRATRATVARNALKLGMGQVATTAMAIGLNAVLGRSLGSHGFGLYYLLTTLATFAYVFVEWGQPPIVIRLVATGHGRSGELLGTSLALRAAVTLATLLPVASAAWLLGYSKTAVWLSGALILASLPVWLAQGYGMLFRGHDRMGSDASVTVAAKASLLAATLLALWSGAGLAGVIAAQAVAGVAALVLAHRLYRRMSSLRLRVSLSATRTLVTGGVPVLAMAAAMSAQPYLDALILSRLAPGNAVGWFGAARNVLGTLIAPANILGAVCYPRLSRAAMESPAAFQGETRAALRAVLLLGALGAAGTYLFAHPVIDLIYGSRGFGPAGSILEFFSPGLLLLFIDMLLGNVVFACGVARWFVVAKILSVVASATADLVLIPYFQARTGNGGIGAVIAFGASEVIVFVGALAVLPRGTIRLAHLVDLGRAVAAGLLSIAAVRSCGELPAPLGIPLCVVAFTASAATVGLLTPRDLELVRSLWRRPAVLLPEATQ
jgi:O-antigen/teichoic acid export membrane protein